MPYILTKTSGTALTTIQDDTIDVTSTSLTLVGKNYAGYGAFLDENFIKLLENFAFSSAPNSPLTGQLWWDSGNTLLKVWTGNQWKQVHTSAAQSTAPTNSITGDLWWDTTNLQLKIWGGSSWIVIGPSTASGGSTTSVGTAVTPSTILDTTNLSHLILEVAIQNNVIGIFSKDASFSLQSPLPGFTGNINPGLNLIGSGSISGVQFTGNASNAYAVNNISSTSLVRSDVSGQSVTGSFSTGGAIQVGADLIIDPTNSQYVQIYTNAIGTSKDLGFWYNRSGSKIQSMYISSSTGGVTIANLVAGGITVSGSVSPTANVSYNLGTPTAWWNNIYGTAIHAQYADLAERFSTDQPYAPGTVVQLGGVNEITAVTDDLSEEVFGVISTRAAYLMNGAAGDDSTHPPVAVNGRVPVKVIGMVRKGDRLVSAGNGLARSASRNELTAFNVIGRSLEDKYTSDEGTIEAIVKLNS